jgi:hypothetical protein
VQWQTLGFALVDIRYLDCHVGSIIADNSLVENNLSEICFASRLEHTYLIVLSLSCPMTKQL